MLTLPPSPPVIMDMVTRMSLGGAALHVNVLSAGLEKRGYRTLLATGVCEETQGDTPAPIHHGCRVYEIPTLSRSISPLRDMAAIVAAYRLMRRERPTIVHTHTAKAGMIGRIAARAAGVPIVVHTFHGNSLSGYFSKRTSDLFCRIERLLGRITDRICVVSDQQLEETSGRFAVAPRAKFQVTPLGMDLEDLLNLPLSVVSGETLNVGWLGRLVDIKCIPLLAATIEEAARRGLPVRFIIGGDGPERGLVQEAVRRFGPERVVWSGWRRDVTAFLAECHVLIQTSRNEGTPAALIQGMAAGRPFVSTAVGGIVDLTCGPAWREERGCRWYSNAVLADSNPASFVNALERFRSEPACLSRMAAASRRFAAERFEAGRLLADMDRLYRKLIDERFLSVAPAFTGARAQKVEGECG